MQRVVHTITLDFLKGGVQTSVRMKKAEAGARQIAIRLVCGSVAYVPGGNTTVQFRAIKPDGTELYNATTIDGSTVYVDVTTQTVAAVGTVRCELSLTDAGGILYTPQFEILVEDYLYGDGVVESTDEYTALTKALASIEPIVEGAETIIASEVARVAAEGLRVSAETERVGAEVIRSAAEDLRAVAESGRAAAEADRAAQFGTVLDQAEGYAADASESAANAEASKNAAGIAKARAEEAAVGAAESKGDAEASKAAAEAARAAAVGAKENAEASAAAASSSAAGAAGSAADAVTEKNAAFAAKGAAETARGQAEAARDAAAGSATVAETAKNAAGTAAGNAQSSATAAAGSATAAGTARAAAEAAKQDAEAAESNVAASAQAAENSAVLSESWAVGGTNTRPGENTNNSAYWADVAKETQYAIIFDTYADMVSWMQDPDNIGVGRAGNNLYILDIVESDYWITHVYNNPTVQLMIGLSDYTTDTLRSAASASQSIYPSRPFTVEWADYINGLINQNGVTYQIVIGGTVFTVASLTGGAAGVCKINLTMPVTAAAGTTFSGISAYYGFSPLETAAVDLGDVIQVVPQTFSAAKQAQARLNINAADKAAFDAHYDEDGNVDGLGFGVSATGGNNVGVAAGLKVPARNALGASNGVWSITLGGTGAATAAAARTALGAQPTITVTTANCTPSSIMTPTNIIVTKYGRICCITFPGFPLVASTPAGAAFHTIYTIPSGYRPASAQYPVIFSSEGTMIMVQILTNGNIGVRLNAGMPAGTAFIGSVTFVCA